MAKILIVDDAAFMRMMVKDTLAKGGYTDCLLYTSMKAMFGIWKKRRKTGAVSRICLCTKAI